MTSAKISKSLMVEVSKLEEAGKSPWLTLGPTGEVTGVFQSRTQARDSKAGKVVKSVDVQVTLEEDLTVAERYWEGKVRKSAMKGATGIAKDFVAKMYGTAKPKEIFAEAQRQGIAFMTVRTMYQEHRRSLGLVKQH